MLFKKRTAILALTTSIFLSSCASIIGPPTPQLNTPSHHASNGMKFLKINKLDAALREFSIAKQLNSKFSVAHAGTGLIQGFNGEFKDGFASLENAFEYAVTNEEKATAKIFLMRFYIVARDNFDKNWLAYVEHNFNEAIAIAPGLSEPYFYMGLAYKIASDFRRASEHFIKVIEIDRGYVKEAEAEYSIIGKIKK